jgi:sterol desaturase/sphingolipid hydroxylase (fatty acid hydroxylase superfamily)
LDNFFDLLKELVTLWLAAFGIQLITYVVTTAIIIQGYRLFWNKGLSKYKIQKREASRADIRREIKSSLRTIVVFSLIYVGIDYGSAAGIFTIYSSIEPLGVTYMLASMVVIFVVQDAYFYWTHRLMHHRRLFGLFHRTHHKSVTPTAYACYSFDLPEAILHGIFWPLWLVVVPMQLVGILVAATLMFVRNVLGHSGVEIFAPAFQRSRWFGWFFTNTDHDHHHTTIQYNFGLYFAWWDRLMGTEYPTSREQARGRLEIVEDDALHELKI